MPASFTFWAISRRVPRTIFCSGQLALYTTATGVSGRYSFRSVADSSSIIPILRKMIMVAWCFARSASFSPSGIGVLPSIRVRITVWLTPGRVYSFFRAAAVARKELTPGMTSYSIPMRERASICSRCAPKIAGSPVCTRTTFRPLSSPSFITASTSSRVMVALL